MKKSKQQPKKTSNLLAKMLSNQPSKTIEPRSDLAQTFIQVQALHNQGKLEQAKQGFQAILAIQPDHSLSMTELGTIHFKQGILKTGVAIIRQSLQLNDAQPAAHSNLGNALHILNCQEEALMSFDRAITLKPDLAEAYLGRSKTLSSLNRHEDALLSCNSAIALKSSFTEAHFHRSNILDSLMRHEEALQSCNHVITLRPDFAEAHLNRSNTLLSLKRYEEALVSCNRAITLKPDFAEAYYNCGNALYLLNRHEEALVSFNSAITLKPNYAKAHSNRSNVLYALNRHNEALVSCDHAITLKPDFAEAYFNKSLSTLLLGDFLQGWPLYEWRWKGGKLSKNDFRNFPEPLWLGEQSISDKTLLLHAEQGLGDTIQFCRYVALVDALAKTSNTKIVLEAPPALIPLLHSLKNKIELVAKDQPLPAFDLHCPLMSLPLAFGTTLENIPADVPYLFTDTNKQATWQQRLGEKRKLRVGLIWSGSTTHMNDVNRSIPLCMLETLTSLNAEFHSLQKEIRPTDQAFLSTLNIQSHTEYLTDFAETAALVAEMDLIISVDTSVAHLAGAMGKPVWILLPFAPDWRWLIGRSNSPWYPTAILFRQNTIGDWSNVISEINSSLSILTQNTGSPSKI